MKSKKTRQKKSAKQKTEDAQERLKPPRDRPSSAKRVISQSKTGLIATRKGPYRKAKRVFLQAFSCQKNNVFRRFTDRNQWSPIAQPAA